jgi:hypothetical protein
MDSEEDPAMPGVKRRPIEERFANYLVKARWKRAGKRLFSLTITHQVL